MRINYIVRLWDYLEHVLNVSNEYRVRHISIKVNIEV